MFDEILDLFDRNRRGRRNGSRPSLLGRMFGGGDHDDEYRSPRGDDRDERGRRRRDADFDD